MRLITQHIGENKDMAQILAEVKFQIRLDVNDEFLRLYEDEALDLIIDELDYTEMNTDSIAGVKIINAEIESYKQIDFYQYDPEDDTEDEEDEY